MKPEERGKAERTRGLEDERAGGRESEEDGVRQKE